MSARAIEEHAVVKGKNNHKLSQAELYDRVHGSGVYGEAAHAAVGTVVDRLWWQMRWAYRTPVNRMYEARLENMRELLGDLRERDLLEIGSARGNSITFYVASQCGSLLCCDLSAASIEQLNKKFRQDGLNNARGIVAEFPLRDVPDQSFDVVYGTGILHHFGDLRGACEEVRRLLRPGGYAVFAETLNTDPLIRVARRLTRRFKSDQDWEFPFDREALRTIRDVFPNTEMFFFDGFTHFVLWAPLFGNRFLRAATGFTNALEERFQRHGGRLAGMCWLVNLLMHKEATDKPDAVSGDGEQ